MKCLEVADLFDIKKSKGETLKNYLACFNNTTVKVNDPDKKNFVKAFQRGLRAGQTQILHEIYHTNLLKHPRDLKGRQLGHNTQEWYEFHKAYGHSTEDCRNLSQKRKASDVLVVCGKADVMLTLVITFGERDMWYDPPRHDEPMVISVVVAEYKVERVLIDQGSSTNILYWSTYMKMG
ncbi:hypothetical protein CR513_17027, partial [Mucuna pruriens]